MFERLCIIGIGLIGSSVARAARKQGLCKKIDAYGREQDLANLQLAKRLNVIDDYFIDIAPAVESADCIVIATPVGAVEPVFKLLRPYWNKDAVYTDVCSTKGSVVKAATTVFGRVPTNFIPAHPIAGAECSGVDAGRADLFDNKRLIITPVEDSNVQALDKVTRFWEGLGSTVSLMEVDHHDTVLAATSHLPHILAFALVDLLGRKDEQVEIFKYAAGGFKDFSRIASSDPTMWLDICMANKQEIIPLIQQLQSELHRIQQMLEQGENQRLFETFTYAREARQRFLDQLEK
ncbi:prephenate dehydrogenase/arogenate dehydrogenase family protein [Methylomarinum sp. Ch1-1]|uniref:prephenate dehydrogenase n=1 Tax=Methylomarinum roseum TaxID=3067653 RepID=A0AAU7P010_9GAMM|nr:prephenate dehydrogenase/arogenate dehydrogenase family protein [Methylomarinum sp. Ch1-1]MDP4520276.1 prephenate dehydrogenase/arogenate dehydrogenase family protein [Methylomarinum sp. Ch1-1]